MLCEKVGGWTVKVVGESAEESPYVTLTTKLIEDFKTRIKYNRFYKIDVDASSASYFWGVGALFPNSDGSILLMVKNWRGTTWQADANFLTCFNQPIISRKVNLGDSIMTAIVIAPFCDQLTRFTDLGRLRLQETERVVALRTELTKCGAKVIEEGDTLTVYPSKLHSAEIETYNDHRMAMCFAILGLKVPGIKLKNPACVKKTFPNFFQKLAAAPPHGLGAIILDAKTGRKLSHDELFAD
jgi:3-phosphoshikimate 1-carboxyvinyltransferase